MNSEVPCYPFLLLWCLNNVDLSVWSKGGKHLGLICWSSSQRFGNFFFFFFCCLTLLSFFILKTSPGHFSSPPFCSPGPYSFSGFCHFTHGPICECKPQVNLSCRALYSELGTAYSTFPVTFALAHDGKTRKITLTWTTSDACFCE